MRWALIATLVGVVVFAVAYGYAVTVTVTSATLGAGTTRAFTFTGVKAAEVTGVHVVISG